MLNTEPTGIAARNLERVLNRTVTGFCLLLFALAVPDLWPTLLKEPAGPFNLCFAAILLSLLGALALPRLRYPMAGTAAIVLIASFAAWQYGLIGEAHLSAARPWSWGYAGAGIGMAALAFGMRTTLAYGITCAVLLGIVPLFEAGSIRSWSESLQDGLLTLAMTAVIAAPIQALRFAARAEDTAASSALAGFTTLARTRALGAERRALDTLTHDALLATLITAARAQDAEVIDAAAAAARDSLARLDSFRGNRPAGADAAIGFAEFMRRLCEAAATYAAPVSGPGAAAQARPRIPLHVADALIHAGMEAVRNALQHASKVPPRIGVKVSETAAGDTDVLLTITDTGPGFVPVLAAAVRLGITESIIGRLETAGGSAVIDSAPGAGTTVSLRWTQRGRADG